MIRRISGHDLLLQKILIEDLKELKQFCSDTDINIKSYFQHFDGVKNKTGHYHFPVVLLFSLSNDNRNNNIHLHHKPYDEEPKAVPYKAYTQGLDEYFI